MEFLFNWLMIVVLMLVCAMAPGPDFVMAIRNSLTYSRRAGIFTALGFALGVCVHVTYCIIGIAAVISQSIMLFNTIKYIGAAYLVYMGFQALRSTGFSESTETANTSSRDIPALKALGMGFMTNLLNPKATMFFFALFTQVIDPHTPLAIQIFYGTTCAVIVAGWFSFVALILTHKSIKNKFLGFAKYIDRTCGGLMIALGLKLALTRGAS